MDAEQFAKFLEMQHKILENMANNTATGSSSQGRSTNIALVPNVEVLDTTKESFVSALASPKAPSELKYDVLVRHLSPKQNVLVVNSTSILIKVPNRSTIDSEIHCSFKDVHQ